METFLRSCRPLALSFSLSLAAPAIAAQSVRLSPAGEHVSSYSLAADGKTVLYLLESMTPRLHWRGLAPRGPAVAVEDENDAGFPGHASLSPDGLRILYRDASDVVLGYRDIDLFSQPRDGSSPPVRLNGPLAPEGDVGWFAVTPDSTRVLYSAGELAGSGLFVVPIDGSAAALPLDRPPLSINRLFFFTPDSTRVVFETHDFAAELYQLWSVPLDGSAPAVAISGARTTRHSFVALVRSRVLYLSSLEPDHVWKVELVSAPVDGSAPPMRLNAPLPPYGYVKAFGLTSDHTRAMYIADQDANYQNEVFVVPVDGSAAPVKASGPYGASFPRARVDDRMWLVADDSNVYWRAYFGLDEMLLRAPLDASAPPIAFYTYRGNRDVDPLLAGERVAFSLRLPTSSSHQLYSVPVDGSSPPIRLHGPLVAGGSVASFQVAGDLVVYVADQDVDDARELFAAPIDGSYPPQRLSVALPTGRWIQSFQVLPGGKRFLYLANPSSPSVSELFLAQLRFDRAR